MMTETGGRNLSKECEVIKDLIPLYVDGVCSDESKARVEEHIEHCPDCLMTVERMKSKLVLPMEDSTDVKGFRKFVNKKIWGRALAVILVFVLLWIVLNWVVTCRWAEVWPKMTAEGIQQAVEVVEIDGMLYLHQNDLEGMGQIVDISTDDDIDGGVLKFYLGEQGLTSLDIFGRARSWMSSEAYQSFCGYREGAEIVQNDGADDSNMNYGTMEPKVINKIVYCHKDGTEVATLWENGQELKNFDSQSR